MSSDFFVTYLPDRSAHDDFPFSSGFLGLTLVRFLALNRVRASTARPPAEVPPAAIGAMDVMDVGHIELHL